MDKYTRLLERSSAIDRYAKANSMDTDQVYEFFFECFCNYRDMFITRLKHGAQLRKIMEAYSHIPEFGAMHPSEITRLIFASREMAYWFAFQWWRAIDTQLKEKRVDKIELQIELTTMGRIPMPATMEDIIYEHQKSTASLLLSEGYAGNMATQKDSVGIEVNG